MRRSKEPDARDELAHLATVIAVEAPDNLNSRTTCVDRRLVIRIRDELDRRKIDWRTMRVRYKEELHMRVRQNYCDHGVRWVSIVSGAQSCKHGCQPPQHAAAKQENGNAQV